MADEVVEDEEVVEDGEGVGEEAGVDGVGEAAAVFDESVDVELASLEFVSVLAASFSLD